MNAVKKSVTILGSTGSVGVNTLRVIRQFPDLFEVAGLAAASRADAFLEQVREFRPKAVYMKESAAAVEVADRIDARIRVFPGEEGLRSFCDWLDADILVAASSGISALLPVIDALERGRRVALANKEILVVAGEFVMRAVKRGQATGARPAAEPAGRHASPLLIPVDSEHNAIFQCLRGNSSAGVRRLILTGSGGPLREVSAERFRGISKEDVVNHPKWKMGRKISVDSATLMNKGLEIIEASWLFGIPVERIEVLIHPEAVIHSMVEFEDGVVLAELGVTDMRLPIQYALCYPERLAAADEMMLDFSRIKNLTFSPPDRAKFPCLDIALAAARRSGSAPCVLSAADETAVNAYLEDKIEFMEIPKIIERVLSAHRHVEEPGLGEIQSIHSWAVEETRRSCSQSVTRTA